MKEIVRMRFMKTGRAKYISHLDLIRCLQRAVCRAKLPAAYSEGFHPHMQTSFATTLPLGFTGTGELMDLELSEPLPCDARHVVGTSAKLLGINTGRLGFLASMEPDQIGEIARLQTGDYRVSKRMLLRGKVLDKTGTCLRELTALNDIVISRNFSRVIEFTVSRNNVVLGEYRADGVIFSTPTGSTAYALSAGGPIIEPEFSCIEMNLICPHSLSARPILFSPHNDLQVSLRVREEYDAYFCADGEKPEPFPEGRVMEISGSDQSLEILDLSGNTFFDSLSRKLMQSLKSGRS